METAITWSTKVNPLTLFACRSSSNSSGRSLFTRRRSVCALRRRCRLRLRRGLSRAQHRCGAHAGRAGRGRGRADVVLRGAPQLVGHPGEELRPETLGVLVNIAHVDDGVGDVLDAHGTLTLARLGQVGDVREGTLVQECDEQHFDADQVVLQAGCNLLRRPALLLRVDHPRLHKQRDDAALPEAEEHNDLDRDELARGVLLRKGFLAAEVKVEQRRERDRDGDVLEQQQPRVGVVRVVKHVVLVVDLPRLADDCDQGAHRLHVHVLHDAALPHDENALPDHNGRQAAEGRGVRQRLLAALPDALRGLRGTAEIVEKELEEGEERERLVAVAHQVQVLRSLLVVLQSKHRRDRVHGHHKQDADDLLLLLRVGVRCEVQVDLEGSEDRGKGAAPTRRPDADLAAAPLPVVQVVRRHAAQRQHVQDTEHDERLENEAQTACAVHAVPATRTARGTRAQLHIGVGGVGNLTARLPRCCVQSLLDGRRPRLRHRQRCLCAHEGSSLAKHFSAHVSSFLPMKYRYCSFY
eukprot:Rhum_TRINITY_DN13704_c12_g1::Rhum_TRINITY_DN13704_c12_g1_i1::g.63797::m.63797